MGKNYGSAGNNVMYPRSLNYMNIVEICSLESYDEIYAHSDD